MRDRGRQVDFRGRNRALAVLLLVMVMVMAGCYRPTGFCFTRRDCPQDQICRTEEKEYVGRCVDPPEFCVADADCPVSQICGVRGQCAPEGENLQSIQLSPMDASIARGTQVQYIPVGIFEDGSAHELTRMDFWDSSDSGIAAVTPDGVAAGLMPGATLISARLGAQSGVTRLKVTDATLTGFEVAPVDLTVPLGAKVQFSATGSFSDGSRQPLTQQAKWSSSDERVGMISNSPGSQGQAVVQEVGTATVTATWGDRAAASSLTVTDATLTDLAIMPASATLARGTRQQFTALGTYSNNSTLDVTDRATWTTANTAVAAVSGGLVLGTGVGTTTISASLLGKTETATLTVALPPGGTMCALGLGGMGNARAIGVAVDSNGNMVILGVFFNTVNLGGGNLSGGLCLAKYTNTCGHVWSRCFSGASWSSSLYSKTGGIAVDGKDNIVLTQTFSGTANVGGAPLVSVGNDILLAKFDAAGTHLWSARYGGTSEQSAYAVAVDSNDYVVLSGSTIGSSDIDMGGGTLARTSGNMDLVVARYSPAGAFQWARRQTGSSAVLDGQGITVDGRNNIVVAGAARGSVDLGSGMAQGVTGNVYFVAQYTAAGAYSWSLLDKAGDPRGVAALGSGDPVVAGSDSNMLLTRYDALSRMAKWRKTPSAYASAIARDSMDQLIVAARTDSGGVDLGGGPLSTPHGGAVVVKYDAGGVHQWSHAYAGAVGSAMAAAIAVGRDRQIAVIGTFEGTINTGAGTLTSTTPNDGVFLLRLTP